MRCAVVDLASNVVINIIVADPMQDVASDGCALVDVDNMACGIGWTYDPLVIDFRDPNPPAAETPADG